MPPLRFDPEATVEKVAGIGRHPRFDVVIDDKEDDSVQVICKRGIDEIPLANPARTFYFGYPPDKQEKATLTVIKQAGVLCREWAPANDK